MRNIFDQYKVPENRLTHALACCLSEDTRLLRRFIQWVAGEQGKRRANLEVVEQRVPGQPVSDSDDENGLGLPDMWIYDRDDEHWSLIIESKVAAPIKRCQLERHRRAARRNGFDDFTLLVISPERPDRRLSWVTYRTWTEVFRWMRCESGKSEWAVRFVDYIQIAEERMATDGYLGDKTLTEFDGIPFDDSWPYSYREAKRILRLLMPELRKRGDLKQELGIDTHGKGKTVIKGKGASEVWDFTPLKAARGQGHFTTYPHLTVAMQERRLLAFVIVPDKIPAGYRRNLVSLGMDGLCTLVTEVDNGVTRAVRPIQGAHPLIHVVQRRFPSRSSAPLIDALLEFNPRTAVQRPGSKVKQQPQWLEAMYNALAHKRSNLTLGIGAALPYGSKALQSPKVLDTIARVWIACRPWLQQLLDAE